MADWMTKTDLQDAIQSGRLAFDNLLDTIPEDRMEEPLLDNGWSAKDTIMHLVAWEQRLIGWVNAAAQGDEPALPAPGYTWEQMDELNEQTYLQQKHRSLDDILASFHASLNLIFLALDRFDDDTLNSKYLGEDSLLWRYFAENTYEHYEEHGEEIRAALGS
jgi:hypothetical protein